MKYEYKKLTIDSYLDSLYLEGFQHSKTHSELEIRNRLEEIGIFRFKGYAKAFRGNVESVNIDDILKLYDTDRDIAIRLFKITSKIEIKLKAYLIEIAYGLTDNPFFYLVKDSYMEEFKISDESVFDWEVKQTKTKHNKEVYLHYRDYYLSKYDFLSNRSEYLADSETIGLNKELDINYPPFHYFIENITLGPLIKICTKLQIEQNSIMKLLANKFGIYDTGVFLGYLLRLKEVRNRCAHNGRIFNRNYRGVKAFGNHRAFRRTIFEHKLIDVYFSLHLLLQEKEFSSVEMLIEEFSREIFTNCEKKTVEFMVGIMRQGKCACSDLP